jgi:hypothetical protein
VGTAFEQLIRWMIGERAGVGCPLCLDMSAEKDSGGDMKRRGAMAQPHPLRLGFETWICSMNNKFELRKSLEPEIEELLIDHKASMFRFP